MKRLNQRGAVSLISVVIFIIIITIVVMAYLGSALSQQRSSVNFDMSTRAYYAAESGIQDAVRELQNSPSPSSKQDCMPLYSSDNGKLGNPNQDYGLSYTCQIIDSEPKDITGTTEFNKLTAMFRLNPTTTAQNYKLQIRWSLAKDKSTDVNGNSVVNNLIPRANSSQTLPQISQWQNNNTPFNAMLRVSLISHPKASVSRSSIVERAAYLNPAQDNTGLTFSKKDAGPQTDLLSNASCSQPEPNVPEEYLCKKTITLSDYDLANDSLYLRVGSLYRNTDFSVVLEGDGVPLKLSSAQATIDVTGKAKDVYRRVRQAFSIKGGYYSDTGLDAALVGGEGICKLFSLSDTPGEFSANWCNPLL